MIFFRLFDALFKKKETPNMASREAKPSELWVSTKILTMLHTCFCRKLLFLHFPILRVRLDLRRFFIFFSMDFQCTSQKNQEPPNFSEERFWGLRHVCCCWVANFGVGQPSGPFAHLCQQDVFGKKCNRHRWYTFHQGDCPSSIEGKNPTLGP